MTTKRLALLLAVLVLGLGSAAFLPRVAVDQPTGVRLDLPEYVGPWFGVDQPVTQRELEVLAKDTEFARKQYTNGAGDTIWVSIVLSGRDLDNSIHRPERCLPAQGWTIADSSTRMIPMKDAGVSPLKITRLHNVRGVPVTGDRIQAVYNVNYYWFVGFGHVTASHLQRTAIDIRDRVLHGYNQRWAYITVAATVTEGLVPFGRSEKETDAMLQDFVQQLYPEIARTPEADRVAQRTGL